MKLRTSILLAIIAILFAGATFAAKPKPKPKPKPAPKLYSIGTAQLPGEWCDFGKAYTLGKLDPMNVTLKSAEYTIGCVKVGDRIFRPKEGEKLLVIHYTLHNPVPREQRVGYAAITWTAVDAKDKNTSQEYLGVGVEDKDHTQLDTSMKQAQKIEVFAIITVDGDGEVPKLMANRYEEKQPVARYDLRGKVTPLPPPYADPSDKTGATVAKEIPGVVGTSYITGDWETNVEKVDFATPPLADESPNTNNDYVVVTLACKNCSTGNAGIGGSGSPTSYMEMKDADGVTYQYVYGPMTASSNRKFDPSAKAGETIKFRLAFSVPKGVQLKSLTLKEYSGYPIIVDLSSYKTP